MQYIKNKQTNKQEKH